MEDYSGLADHYELAADGAAGFFESGSCTGLLGDALLCPRPRSLEAERGDEDGVSAVLSSCRSGNASSSGDSAASGGGRCKRPAAGAFEISFARSPAKRPPPRAAGSIDFRREADPEAAAQVKEMIYRAAAFRPVTLGADEAVTRPRRRNVRISSDPQTVAARHRRERISERLRALQRLVPGGSKLDTASMLDEAANYLKFLKSQVVALENSTTHVNGGVIACTTSGALASPFFPTLLHPPQLPSHDGRNDCTQSHPAHRRGSVSM